MPALNLFQRSDSSTDFSLTFHNSIGVVSIVGIILIALIFFGLCLWLALRFYRKRAAARRESKMGAAFLSVKGLVQDDGLGNEKDILTSVSMFNQIIDKDDIDRHFPFLDGRKH